VSGANDKRGTQIVKFIAGFVVAIVIMAGAALAIMYTGSYNVAASVPDNPIVEWYLSNTMIHSVTSRANAVKAPPRDLPSTTRPAFIATARRAKIRPISLKALILKRPI
jgi:hypothetical protein